MLEDRQLVLFYNNSFNVDELADTLVRKFAFLDEVMVIPKTEENTPLIIFQKGEVKLTVFHDSVNINYLKDFEFNNIIEIIETMEDSGFTFHRMGYIFIYFHTNEEKEYFKKNTFFKEDKRSDEFQLYRYNRDLIDSVKVNVVEIERTNPEDNISMSTIFDINTPLDEKYNITSSFLTDFIKECDRYIKRVIENNLKK